jgi:hypothetical protein
MLYRWWRMDDEGRRRVWKLYVWFTAFMFCGCCFGAFTWSARLQVRLYTLASTLESGTTIESLARLSASRSVAFNWRAAYTVTYAIEFLFLSIAKLVVLERMIEFSAPQSASKSKRWVFAERIVVGLVVFGNLVGLAGNIASSTYFKAAANSDSNAADSYLLNNTAAGDKFRSETKQKLQEAYQIAAVQSLSEVTVLLLIIIAFAISGFVCVRRFRSVFAGLKTVTVSKGDKTLRFQILGTTVVIFFAFLLRSVFSAMWAASYGLQLSNSCPGKSDCDPCHNNDFTYLWYWIGHIIEFQLLIMLISSPIALLIALWGMTSKLTLIYMNTNKRGQTPKTSLTSVRPPSSNLL